MTMQRAMNPSPWAHPNTIVSVSNPGTNQNKINPPNTPSSTQERRLTQTNSSPGTGFLIYAPGVSAVSTIRSCSRACATEYPSPGLARVGRPT